MDIGSAECPQSATVTALLHVDCEPPPLEPVSE